MEKAPARPSRRRSTAAIQFTIGQRVRLKGQGGIVRFVGPTEFAGGHWVGVELDDSSGKNDGTIMGVTYFNCEPEHGVFVRASQLELDGGGGASSSTTPPGRGKRPVPQAANSHANASLPHNVSSGQAMPEVMNEELQRFASTANQSGAVLRGFDATLVSEFVKAQHTDESGQNWLYGVVFGDGQVPRYAEGHYFEVRLEARRCVNFDMPDGLTIGVATWMPKASDQPAETADDVPHSWSLGYDGNAHIDGTDGMVATSWQPKDLQKGDVVGLLLKEHAMCVFVNARLVAEVRCNIPQGVPLYAFVDILGTASSVSIRPGAAPPLRNAPPKPTRPSRPPPAAKLRSFDRQLLSNYVCVSPDGMRAEHRSRTGEELHGVVFGDQPVRQFAAGAYFEVSVALTRAIASDGLTLGVTTDLPQEDGWRPVLTADELPNSWSLGYDGAAYINGEEDMKRLDWNPKDLCVGDRVGLLVTSFGELCAFVNGRKVAHVLDCDVPLGRPLYAVVDLLGNTAAVDLLPDATPPAGGQKIVF